jgi:hypothetical protein
LIKNSNSKTRKNSLTGLAKANTSMVGGMFIIATMSYWGKRFIEIGIGFGLLGIVPSCVMATYSAA